MSDDFNIYGKNLNSLPNCINQLHIEKAALAKNINDKSRAESTEDYAELYIDDAAFGAPLVDIPGFNRSCINWFKIREALNIDERLKGLKQ